MSAISGSFVKVLTMADGTPRVTIDLDCTLMECAQVFEQGAAVAIARLTQEAAIKDTQEKTIKRGQTLSQYAALLCKNPKAWEFFGVSNETEARQHILDVCDIDSRAALDYDDIAAVHFHDVVRKPFAKWMEMSNDFKSERGTKCQ